MSKPNRGNKIANAMSVYALVFPAAYFVGYTGAPDEAALAAVGESIPLVVAAAVSMLLCAVLCRLIERVYVLGMIGIHLGLLMPLVWAGVFLRAGLSDDVVAGPLRTPFTAAGAISIVAFVAILALRPKKSERV